MMTVTRPSRKPRGFGALAPVIGIALVIGLALALRSAMALADEPSTTPTPASTEPLQTATGYTLR